MLAINTMRYPAKEGLRAGVVSIVYGACDRCQARCEESQQFDGETYWSQAMAFEKSKSAGWLARITGRLQQLICPACQKAEAEATE